MSLPQTYKAFVTNGPGKQPTLEQLPLKMPAKNQILVKVAFVPVNPSDLMTTQDQYPTNLKVPYAVGLEGSGIVVALGEDLKTPHNIGDRVHILSVGTYAEYVLADSENCRKIKGDLPLEQAASHYINPMTVVCMGDYVKKNGHKAVIHTAGSSALGRMFIRYFKYLSIPTINVVRKDEYIEELKKEGADYVLNSESPDFEKQLREIAHKEEATIAFDAVIGDMTGKILRNQPDGSTVAIYGLLAGPNVTNIGGAEFLFKGKTVTGFWLGVYLKQAKKTGDDVRLVNELVELLPTVLSSQIQKVFKLENVEEALEYYWPNSSKGKILIQLNESL